ncbi:NAD(P)-binding domain-containing protein [Saccharothrix sp. NPDC042600]|uniref:NAD(P)-dependent oxidoreductase n=1 Tax=Saccharothrix sp. NPDC042600 TaxID=3154492 RepID=UPI0034019E4D
MTVIGLGPMGQALAGAFLRAGHPTTVWNRTAAKADPLVAAGAALAGSVEEAVAAGGPVVACVSDLAVLRRLLDPAADVLAGRVVVNLTTGTSREVRETAEWVAGRGAAHLAGAILALPRDIGTGTSLVLYSGSPEAFERHATTLRGLGEGAVHLGADQGLAALYAAAGVTLMWSTLNGFLHGTAMLAAAGVDASTFVEFARQNIATTAGWLPGYARQVEEGSYPAPDATVESHLAAMDLLVRESETSGVDAGLPRFVRAVAERAVAAGHGRDSYAALVEVFRRPAQP